MQVSVSIACVYKKRHPDFLWKISYKISDDSIRKELSQWRCMFADNS